MTESVNNSELSTNDCLNRDKIKLPAFIMCLLVTSALIVIGICNFYKLFPQQTEVGNVNYSHLSNNITTTVTNSNTAIIGPGFVVAGWIACAYGLYRLCFPHHQNICTTQSTSPVIPSTPELCRRHPILVMSELRETPPSVMTESFEICPEKTNAALHAY